LNFGALLAMFAANSALHAVGITYPTRWPLSAAAGAAVIAAARLRETRSRLPLRRGANPTALGAGFASAGLLVGLPEPLGRSWVPIAVGAAWVLAISVNELGRRRIR
jgi:hypothetical protein